MEPESDVKRQRLACKQLHGEPNASNSVSFSSLYPRDFKLIEIPPDLLKAIEAGEDLRVVGDHALEARLCSESKTYTMKRVETSNSVFFVPPSSSQRYSIESVCSDYYELKPAGGCHERVNELLQASVYPSGAETGTGDAAQPLPTLYSFSELEQLVPASVSEIRSSVASLGAVEVDGKLRTMAEEAVREVGKALLETVVALDWGGAAQTMGTGPGTPGTGTICKTLAQYIEVLPDADVHVLRFVLARNSASASAGGAGGSADAADAEALLALPLVLCMEKLKAACAHIIFQERGQRLSSSDFLQEWSLRAPGLQIRSDGGVAPSDLALLHGIAVQVRSSGGGINEQEQGGEEGGLDKEVVFEEMFAYLPAESLPRDAKDRLRSLFSLRDGYSLAELQPYLAHLDPSTPLGSSVKELLSAHCRVEAGEGGEEPLYYAK